MQKKSPKSLQNMINMIYLIESSTRYHINPVKAAKWKVPQQEPTLTGLS